MGGASAAKVLSFTSTGEAAWGTSGATTKKLHGVTDCSLSVVEKVEAVPQVGWYGPGPVAAEVEQSGEGQIEGIVLFEDFPNLLNGVFTAIGASATTAAPYSFAYTAPVTSTQACYTYTLEWGTTGLSYTSIGSIVNGLTVKGEAGGLWSYSAPVVSKQIKPVTPTTAAWVDRAVNPVRMADTTLYMDAFSTGTAGGTAVAASLISFELSVDAKRHMKTFAGSLNPGSWGDNKMEGTLKTVLEFGSTSKTLLDGLLGSTGAALQRQIRIKASQSSSSRTMTLDFAGIVGENIKLWDDRDGNMTVDLTWKGQYSSGLTNWLAITVTHGSSSTT